MSAGANRRWSTGSSLADTGISPCSTCRTRRSTSPGARLGKDATRVRWIVHDLLTWRPPRRFGRWHDRAVFHFLVTPGPTRHLSGRAALGARAWRLSRRRHVRRGRPGDVLGSADRTVRTRRPRRRVRSRPRDSDQPTRRAPHPRRRHSAIHLAPPSPIPHLRRHAGPSTSVSLGWVGAARPARGGEAIRISGGGFGTSFAATSGHVDPVREFARQ